MYTRIYKNNSFSVKRDAFDDGTAASIAELIERIHNDIDAPDVFKVDGPCYGGNSYAYYEVHFWVNGKPREYHIDDDDLSTYNAGRTLRCIYVDDTPMFVMPDYYDCYSYVLADGTRGALYKLCDKADAIEWDDLLAAGCKRFICSPQYAPEIKHAAVFVPNGTCFSYC